MLNKPLLISILWALFILLLCLIPGEEIDKYNRIDVPYLDKLVHIIMYWILGVLLASSIRRSLLYQKNPFIAYLSVIILALLWGGGIELLQGYHVFSREPDVFDFIADAVGVVSGLLSYFFLKRIVIRLYSRN